MRLEPLRRQHTPAELRCAAAICAAACGVLICLYQRHFVLSLAQPRSFQVMLTHRCGVVMLVAVTWALLECAALLLPPARVRQ